MFIFIIGVLISVFSGSFEVVEDMQLVKFVILIFLGVVVGLLNVTEGEERDFLIASGVFIVSSSAIINLMQNFNLLSNLAIMLNNLMVFISPAAIVIALKIVFLFASESNMELKLDMPKQSDRDFWQEMWNSFLLLAVALVFVILILESFFEVSKIQKYLDIADLLITVVFVIDLIVLFRKSDNLQHFMKRNWVDILAVIPLGSMFKLAKVIRAVRIVKVLSRTQKITKASTSALKTNRFLKFFSKDSGFNKYVDDSPKTVKNRNKKSSSKKKRSSRTTKKTKK